MNDLTITDAEPDTRTGTARVAYSFTVRGTESGFSANTTVSGSAAEAALPLVSAVAHDVHAWLVAQQRPAAGMAVQVVRYGPFPWQCRVPVRAKNADPAGKPEKGTLTAMVVIDGESHAYTAEFSTVGDPWRATAAAVDAAKEDLRGWLWDKKHGR